MWANKQKRKSPFLMRLQGIRKGKIALVSQPTPGIITGLPSLSPCLLFVVNLSFILLISGHSHNSQKSSPLFIFAECVGLNSLYHWHKKASRFFRRAFFSSCFRARLLLHNTTHHNKTLLWWYCIFLLVCFFFLDTSSTCLGM